MINLKLPHIRKSIYPIIGTMTIFQLSLQQTYPFSNLKNIEWPSDGIVDTLILQNGIFILGCIVGTQIQKKLKNYSNKFIFLLSDILYFFSTLSQFLLFQYQKSQNDNYLELYFVIRIVTGISVGINLTQSIIYVKRMSTKQESQFFYKLIPLSLIIGQCIGMIEWNFNTNQNNSTNSVWGQFLISFLIFNIVVVIRMILLQFLTIETPHYYMNILQDTRLSKQIFQKINQDNVQTYYGFQLQEQQINQIEDSSDYMISTSYLKKYFKCCLLIFFTVFSGQSLFFTFQISKLSLNYKIYCTLIGIVLILIQMFLYQFLLRKKIICIIGQMILCGGLFYVTQNSQGLFVLQAGYCIGLGTQIYSIIGYELPEFGILYCINIQWIMELVQMCFLGWHITKLNSSIQFDELSQFYGLFIIYVFISAIGFILLFIIFRSPLKTHPQNDKEN